MVLYKFCHSRALNFVRWLTQVIWFTSIYVSEVNDMVVSEIRGPISISMGPSYIDQPYWKVKDLVQYLAKYAYHGPTISRSQIHALDLACKD